MKKSFSFEEHIKSIQKNVFDTAISCGRDPNKINILAVTKTVEPMYVNKAIKCGVNIIGENRVQEFLSKEDEYELKDTKIHFIGTLQRNKVKYIIDKVDLIESVNKLSLAAEIDKESKKAGIFKEILVVVNIGDEQSKTGAGVFDVLSLVEEISKLENIKVMGLMCIPPFTTDMDKTRGFFSDMYKIFVDIKTKKIDNVTMDILSMGMSADYKIAIECGSTQVRLGTLLFGKR